MHLLGARCGGESYACLVLLNPPQQPCTEDVIIIFPFTEFKVSEKQSDLPSYEKSELGFEIR